MLELFFLGVALSMDAFAISIGLGASRSTQKVVLPPWIVASYFAAFHALMPFAGFLIGANVFRWFETLSKWICFAILLFIGVKAIYEYIRERNAPNKTEQTLVNHAAIFALTLAVSIDAFAAGFTLVLLPVTPIFACLMIGLITFAFSIFGEFLGKRGGLFLQDKANLLGGIILVFVGLNILLS